MPRKPFYKVTDASKVSNPARVLEYITGGSGIWVKFNRGGLKGFVNDFYIFNKAKGSRNYSYFGSKSLKFSRPKKGKKGKGKCGCK